MNSMGIEQPKREIWFTDTRRLFWVGFIDPQRVVHWKGVALYVAAIAVAFSIWKAADLTNTLDGLWWKVAMAIAIAWFWWTARQHTEFYDDV